MSCVIVGVLSQGHDTSSAVYLGTSFVCSWQVSSIRKCTVEPQNNGRSETSYFWPKFTDVVLL